jgi:hypothetical protein
MFGLGDRVLPGAALTQVDTRYNQSRRRLCYDVGVVFFVQRVLSGVAGDVHTEGAQAQLPHVSG